MSNIHELSLRDRDSGPALFPIISGIDDLNSGCATVENPSNSLEMPIGLVRMDVSTRVKVDSILPALQQETFQKDYPDAENLGLDMATPHSLIIGGPRLSSDHLVSEVIESRISRSPAMNGIPGDFETHRTSTLASGGGGPLCPIPGPIHSRGTPDPQERSIGDIWQEALFSTQYENSASSAIVDQLIVDAKTVQNNFSLCRNTSRQSNTLDLDDNDVSLEIYDLLGTFPDCPISSEEEPRVLSNISLEQADTCLPSHIPVVQKSGGCQVQFADHSEIESGNVDEHTGSSPLAASAEVKGSNSRRGKTQTSPRHTPDKPNWAIAPDDPPKVPIPPTRAPKSESRLGNRRGRRSGEDSNKAGTSLPPPAAHNVAGTRTKANLLFTRSNQAFSCDTARGLDAKLDSNLHCAGKVSDVSAAACHDYSVQTMSIQYKNVAAKGSDGDMLAETQQREHRPSQLSNFGGSREWGHQSNQATSSRLEPEASADLSAWQAYFGHDIRMPISSFEPSLDVGRSPGLTRPVDQDTNALSKGSNAATRRYSVQAPQRRPHFASNTSKVLDSIPWPSLEEEIRFHAVERALSQAEKEPSHPAPTGGMVTQGSHKSSFLEEPGCLVPISKVGHAAFVESAGDDQSATAKVLLPTKISGVCGISQQPVFQAPREVQIQPAVPDNGNDFESLHVDTFSWDGSQFSAPARRGVRNPVSSISEVPERRPLPPRPQTAHPISPQPFVTRQRMGPSDGMYYMRSPRPLFPGSAENQDALAQLSTAFPYAKTPSQYGKVKPVPIPLSIVEMAQLDGFNSARVFSQIRNGNEPSMHS